MLEGIKNVFRSGRDDLSAAAISIYHYMNIRLSRGRQRTRCGKYLSDEPETLRHAMAVQQ